MKTRNIFIIIFLLSATTSFGQNLEKGIYKGKKLPFTICYLTHTNSTIEVEYFFEKGGQIFGHIPAKKLEIASSSTKPALKSQDDSIKVFIRSDHFLIKRKGLGKAKVYKSTDTKQTVVTLRNQNRLYSVSQNLYNEYQLRPNFDQQRFWDKLHSYNLDEYIILNNEKFNAKIEETVAEMKKNWLLQQICTKMADGGSR